MRLLITNDDGIQATGLNALRRALSEIPGLHLHVIAPNSNRSATARSITTRSPLWVEEISFDDGSIGYATDGTPVDCVRFAELGLIGERPELIVSGINHGSNLGDDITYSGTVAAALEGIVLGIPAIAISAVRGGGWTSAMGRSFDFSASAAFAAQLVRRVAEDPLPADTLINVNFPAGPPTGVEVTHLGKRLYNDEMKLVEEDPETGRHRYRIYGFEPSFEDEEGSDLSAIARDRISVTPVHFDLTDRPSLDRLREWDFAGMLADGGAENHPNRRLRERAQAGQEASRGAPASDRAPRPRLLRPRRAGDLGSRVRRPPPRAQGDRGGAPRAAHPDSPTQRVGGEPLDKFKRVEHAEPMLSLANARNEDELRAWAKRVERNLERLDIEGSEIRYVTEPKVDGLAISLTYENGVLTRGATRGRRAVGRGGDPQPADDEVDPALDRRRARAGRGPRRGLPAAGRLRAVNEPRAQEGEPTFANPATRPPGRSASSTQDRRLTAALDLVLRRRRPQGMGAEEPSRSRSSGSATGDSG